jgi:hypothetical protein
MADAKIRYNPDHSVVEFAPPEGDEYGPMETPDDEVVILADADDPGNAFLAVLDDGYEGLPPNTIYKLVPVATILETVKDLEADDTILETVDDLEADEEEEDDEEDEEEVA